jgi:type IV secretory pathway protease TraF
VSESGFFGAPVILRLQGFEGLVAIQPLGLLAMFLADGDYLPRGIPMLKGVLALPRQTVCRDRLAVTVDKVEAGNYGDSALN